MANSIKEQVRSNAVPVDGKSIDEPAGATNHFHIVSTITALVVGGAYTLACTVALTAVWLLFGWWAAFPEEWFLATNLVMTLAVFMILLLLQHERRIHMKAIHAKLDELIRSSEAGNHLIAA